METGPERDPQQTAQCGYSIPCECDRRYIGETRTDIYDYVYKITSGISA
jgi:hypothetical protein